MSLAAMQPYLFPYLGYFQLMDCVDTYVFCGDLQYIKRGWVNRNRIFTDFRKREVQYFSFSVSKDIYTKKINQRYYCNLKSDCNKLKNILFQNYKRALNFEEAYCVIEEAMKFQNDNVAYFNMHANYKIAEYLGIKTKITCTDIIENEMFWNKFYQLDYENRAIFICHYFKEKYYINAIGGASLYHKNIFSAQDVELKFIKMDEIIYPQFQGPFISGLSIIDVIMHNKIQDVKQLLGKYQLI